MEPPDALWRITEMTGISPDRWGERRLKDLPEQERTLYRWILGQFLDGHPPTAEMLAEFGAARGLDPEAALDGLEERDLVQRDAARGGIAVAYPFAGYPTAHRVRLDHGRPVYAMCALDALGIAFMVTGTTTVTSHDPLTEEAVRVEVNPADGSRWEPETAVLMAGSSGGEGTIATRCCSVINFFQSGENAERYLETHPQVQAGIFSISEALQAGQYCFGQLLEA